MKLWRLEGHEPVPCTMEEWSQMFSGGDAARRVAHTDLITGGSVSTVFLGLDHRFLGDGPPLLFETMSFGTRGGEIQVRYSTWDEAERGHAEVVAELTQRRAGAGGK